MHNGVEKNQLRLRKLLMKWLWSIVVIIISNAGFPLIFSLSFEFVKHSNRIQM